MYALLLSAGRGERLRPLTDKIPKCMLPVVDNEPLITTWIRNLIMCSMVEHIFISVGYKKDVLMGYIENRHKALLGRISFIDMGDPALPTGNAVVATKNAIHNTYGVDSGTIMAINSDTVIHYTDLLNFHTCDNRPKYLIGVSYGENIKDQGHVILNKGQSKVDAFKEKDSKAASGYFYSGIAKFSIEAVDNSFEGKHISLIFEERVNEGIQTYQIKEAVDIGKSLDEYRRIYETYTSPKHRHHVERLDINDGNMFKPGTTMFGGVRGDHISRYLFAQRYVIDKEVLELGCGTGYGAKILSYSASKIIGIDKDHNCEKAFKEMDCAQPQCYVHFDQADLNQSGFGGKYDVIVAFEFIEHIRNPERIIEQAYKALKTGGLLIISAPNESIEGKGMSIYHDHIFDYMKFKCLIETQFSPDCVQWYGQNQTYFNQTDIDKAQYFIAIARK